MITLPKTYSTDVLTDSQLWFLASRLPQLNSWTGRKAYTNIELLPGILQVLRSGCRWRDLDLRKKKGEASGVTHWRRLQLWIGSGYFPKLWSLILRKLQGRHKLNLSLLTIDGTLVESFAFKDCTGYSGQKKKMGVKVANVVDRQGLPLTFTVDTGNSSDLTMAQPALNSLHVPKEWVVHSTLLADKGYNSRAFKYYLLENFLKANISPNQSALKHAEDDLIFRPYDYQQGLNRYVVERTNAWIKSFRKLKFRYDRTKRSFEAFLYLAALVICLKRLL